MIMAGRRAHPQAIDLLAWPAVAEARARLAAAAIARETAQRRWRFAPHGQVESRLKALREATQEELTAAAALDAIMREAVH